jgi:IS30 family transposase
VSKGGPVSPEEEKAILAALEEGRSVRDVGREFDRSNSTISDVAKRNGLDLAERSEAKKAAIAKSCYAAEDRIKLIGELLNKAKELMKTCDSSRDLQYLATAIAIGIDKRRLEESTDPSARGGEIRILFEKMTAEEAGP